MYYSRREVRRLTPEENYVAVNFAELLVAENRHLSYDTAHSQEWMITQTDPVLFTPFLDKGAGIAFNP